MLEGLTEAPQMSIDDVSLLSAGERQTVLHTFNESTLKPPSGPYHSQTIHGMLEYWAAQTPSAPAVEFEASAHPLLCCCLHIQAPDGAIWLSTSQLCR